MKLYYINLDRREDRKKGIEKQLSSLNLEYQRTSATDGSKADFQTSHFRAGLSATEMACAMSHLNAISKFLSSNEEWGCICEDDIILSSDISQWLRDVSWIPDDARVVSLEVSLSKAEVGSKSVLSQGEKHAVRNRILYRTGEFLRGSAGYLIHRDAGKEMLEKRDLIRTPYDLHLYLCADLSFVKKSKIWRVNPGLIRQHWQDTSDLAPSRAHGTRKTFGSRLTRRISRSSTELRKMVQPSRKIRLSFS